MVLTQNHQLQNWLNTIPNLLRSHGSSHIVPSVETPGASFLISLPLYEMKFLSFGPIGHRSHLPALPPGTCMAEHPTPHPTQHLVRPKSSPSLS